MRSPLSVVLAVGLWLVPLQASWAQRYVVELSAVGGLSHHDFHYRYPGEGRWEDPLGVRLDVRRQARVGGEWGIALTADRYEYGNPASHCLSGCGPRSLVPGGDPTAAELLHYTTAWQVSRVGLGVTWQQAVLGPIGVNAGVLAGGSRRGTIGPTPLLAARPEATAEWFAGAELGGSVRLGHIVLGLGGEYGRVPRTASAVRPYYGRLVARIGVRGTR